MCPPTDQADPDRGGHGAIDSGRVDSGAIDSGRADSETTDSRSGALDRTASRLLPGDRWLTGLAYAVVAVPFAFAVGRLLASPSPTLPDDLALIDLHVRRALIWKQQLGVFDHSGWSHPGPTYFYLLSLVYRLFGSSTRSLFVGATLIGGLSAVACLSVVLRRTSPIRALWAAVCIGGFAAVLAVGGTSATTYSESLLGALVSPWNPTVVLFPLLLLLVLCAGAVDRSGLSLIGALLAGSFVVQTDISTLPLAASLIGVAGVVWLVTFWSDRRHRSAPTAPIGPWGIVLAVLGLVGLVLMWVPPVVQQLTNHPGNLSLLHHFFTSGQTGQSVGDALRSVVASFAVPVVGPAEIMTTLLGGTPEHLGVAVVVTVVTVVVSVVVVGGAAHRKWRFALGVGVLTLVGSAAAVVAFAHIVGRPFGYLGIWASVLPVAALIGLGTVASRGPRRPPRPTPADSSIRTALCVVAVAVAAVACIRVAALPSLSEANDPHVVQLAELVRPHLDPRGRVVVTDAGAGTSGTQLLDLEEFIGLVNVLDRAGYRPSVNSFWTPQFGPGYLSDGTESHTIQLSTWSPDSPSQPGYVGRVGDMAVTVTRG